MSDATVSRRSFVAGSALAAGAVAAAGALAGSEGSPFAPRAAPAEQVVVGDAGLIAAAQLNPQD